ncbi:MAG TPA: protein kinase [Candidatus Bathyarchaeia archaeon]|nr:protein kinase [Candidatus Bathyarchaeia archaeon]
MRASQATTLTRRGTSVARGMPLLLPGQQVRSAETGTSYRVERLLGTGGYGQVYLSRRLGRSATVPQVLCLKISPYMDGWLREAYFGQQLDGHPRAIGVYDRFVLPADDAPPLYVLALEYARHGDLSAYLRRTDKAWSERTARREIAGILEVLGKLHRGQMLHRDLTPMNVFVCEGPKLKLGDFGIVRSMTDRRAQKTRTFNPHMAPSEVVAGVVPKWQARDDVYQIGQLIAMLVKGDARERIRPSEVRKLTCSDELKEIVHRCIGERRKRYESATDLIQALDTQPKKLRSGVLKTLKGVHLAFTGILSKTRKEAAKAAKRAGAIVHDGPSASTTVLVRGRPNPLQAAGRDAGIKLMEIKRLRAKGHKITLLNESKFWTLVSARGSRPPRGR